MERSKRGWYRAALGETDEQPIRAPVDVLRQMTHDERIAIMERSINFTGTIFSKAHFSVELRRAGMTLLGSPVSAVPPRSCQDTVLEVCTFLPNPFTVQDVVRAVAIHCPENIDDLPIAWESLLVGGKVSTLGLCGNVFHVPGANQS
jgi:hypothetical protein